MSLSYIIAWVEGEDTGELPEVYTELSLAQAAAERLNMEYEGRSHTPQLYDEPDEIVREIGLPYSMKMQVFYDETHNLGQG